MIRVGMLVQLEAKPEYAEELAKLMTEGVSVINEEVGTQVWFFFRISPTRFGIFDAFPDDGARQAHLEGKLAMALRERAPRILASKPSIERVEVLAEKIAGAV